MNPTLANTVKVFSSATCSPCVTLKRYLSMRNVSYEEIDVTDAQNMSELLNLTGRMITPTLYVQNGDKQKVVVGLNLPSVSSALEIVS